MVTAAKPRPSRSLAARAARLGIHIDAMRRMDREKRRKNMSPAGKEDLDMRERPRRR